ncbi:MAG: anti-sigma factor family protein [Vicinamibacterales bacterium]
MISPEIEALAHGAVDNTLTPEERETLHRLMAEDVAVRNRVADLERINDLLASLGSADAPPDLVDNVLARIAHPAAPQSVAPFIRRSTPKRGETVNKKMIFGLAAAAAVVLAVITYTSYPPATEGTEATIGAAQRAQTPQIASKDVGLGDISAQDMLQSETWDAIMKDEDLRASLQDADVRAMLQDVNMRKALENEAVRNAMREPQFAQYLKQRLSGDQALSASEARSLNARVEAAFANDAFARALANKKLAANLLNARAARALSSDAMARALRDANFDAALRSDRFARALASYDIKK